jgi:hypothetical protein
MLGFRVHFRSATISHPDARGCGVMAGMMSKENL